MSHCIWTEIEGKDIYLTAGSSRTTIKAVGASGFEIYNIFNAEMCDAGMSGSGDGIKISYQMAKEAYKHAIAWSIALKLNFPDQYETKVKELQELDESSLKADNKIFSESELKDLIFLKIEQQRTLDNDQIIRAFNLLHSIVNFTSQVENYLRKRDSLEIIFA